MEVVALIKRVEETKVVGTSSFKIRDVVVTTEEQHTQTLSIQFVQEKVSLLDNLKPGQRVKIQINLRGKEVVKDGKTNVFNTIQGWKIDQVN